MKLGVPHLGLLAFLVGGPPRLQAQSAGADEYTRYQLLAPEGSSFRILYDVTATAPGSRFFFNPSARAAKPATSRSPTCQPGFRWSSRW